MRRIVRLLGRRGRPNFASLAMSHEDALRVAAAKSAWMAQYLRARRQDDVLLGYFRRNHLASAARARRLAA